jgi:hypothetical protein
MAPQGMDNIYAAERNLRQARAIISNDRKQAEEVVTFVQENPHIKYRVIVKKFELNFECPEIGLSTLVSEIVTDPIERKKIQLDRVAINSPINISQVDHHESGDLSAVARGQRPYFGNYAIYSMATKMSEGEYIAMCGAGPKFRYKKGTNPNRIKVDELTKEVNKMYGQNRSEASIGFVLGYIFRDPKYVLENNNWTDAQERDLLDFIQSPNSKYPSNSRSAGKTHFIAVTKWLNEKYNKNRSNQNVRAHYRTMLKRLSKENKD